MSISSVGSTVNTIAHVVSHVAENDSVAPQTQHPETTANPQSPLTTSSSMASLVPTGGFHPVAGGQATATAKGGGGVFGPLRELRDKLQISDKYNETAKGMIQSIGR